MIQEKDFLYRVPVKNALVTAPGKQVRNPEILVDLEGGEFMHGNILDANSTNKLIDQSVKDAIDNSIENGNYVTKDLLEAETSARTKSDEDLNAKIKAEQTRAEGKEKEISDKLAIIDGDSNTEGSFRKAIADVIAAAPEDLDTLKEIADKLAGNDDLHTALNQAITEKADASALANEVSRATGVENDLRTAIGTKADATALSNYVLTTALNQQIDTLNAAISAKQDAGNYIPCNPEYSDLYLIDNPISMQYGNQGITIRPDFIAFGGEDLSEATTLARNELYFTDRINSDVSTTYSLNGITSSQHNNCLATSDGTFKPISDFALKTDIPQIDTSDFVSKTATDIQTIESDLDLRQRLLIRRNNLFADYTSILYSGITIDGMDSYIYISGSNDYTGENNNPSGIKVRDSGHRDMYTSLNQNSITINNKTDNKAENIFICAHCIFSRKLDESRPSGFGDDLFLLNENGVRILNGDDYHVLTSDCSTIDIREYARRSELPTTATKESLGVVKVGDGLNVADGTISVDTTVLPAVPTNVSQLTNDYNFITQQDADAKYALVNSLNTVNDSISNLRVGLSKKQDKITVNSVDVTDIETADITKLRTIVINLIDALSTSGLIRQSLNLEQSQVLMKA